MQAETEDRKDRKMQAETEDRKAERRMEVWKEVNKLVDQEIIYRKRKNKPPPIDDHVYGRCKETNGGDQNMSYCSQGSSSFNI
ncbi:hypothetical protein LXL04_020502 [Taraxacum kok-saghyz]